jgi:DNA-binding IclR family transcriptional regulator
MQIEYTPKNKASLEDVRLGLQFRNIRPTVRNIMQEFSIGQRRAAQMLHALVQEGTLTQDEETKRFSLKPDDAAIQKTSLNIRELTRLTLERYAQKSRKREIS